jgi:hypothetical protein
MKKFGFLALEGVADELQHPSQDEENCAVKPEPAKEDCSKKKHKRKHNRGNSQSVASPVDWVLVASSVLRDPLLAGPSA